MWMSVSVVQDAGEAPSLGLSAKGACEIVRKVFMVAGEIIFLVTSVTVVAFLYSSVGHAGASGYIAVLALWGFAPDAIKPLALFLNILVASITTWQFCRAGHFSWQLFWPFALLAVPCAFLGGYLGLPARYFNLLVGVVLLYSAARFMLRPGSDAEAAPPPRGIAVLAGGALGFLAGLTGTGGGIFLTPLLLLKRWARVKSAAAVSALFILVNSSAGLLGNLNRTNQFPPIAFALAAAVIFGGTLGSFFGSRRFDQAVIKKLLAAVLLVAGAKLILTA